MPDTDQTAPAANADISRILNQALEEMTSLDGIIRGPEDVARAFRLFRILASAEDRIAKRLRSLRVQSLENANPSQVAIGSLSLSVRAIYELLDQGYESIADFADSSAWQIRRLKGLPSDDAKELIAACRLCLELSEYPANLSKTDSIRKAPLSSSLIDKLAKAHINTIGTLFGLTLCQMKLACEAYGCHLSPAQLRELLDMGNNYGGLKPSPLTVLGAALPPVIKRRLRAHGIDTLDELLLTTDSDLRSKQLLSEPAMKLVARAKAVYGF